MDEPKPQSHSEERKQNIYSQGGISDQKETSWIRSSRRKRIGARGKFVPEILRQDTGRVVGKFSKENAGKYQGSHPVGVRTGGNYLPDIELKRCVSGNALRTGQ